MLGPQYQLSNNLNAGGCVRHGLVKSTSECGSWLSCCDAGDVHLMLGWDQGLGGIIKGLLEPKADKPASHKNLRVCFLPLISCLMLVKVSGAAVLILGAKLESSYSDFRRALWPIFQPISNLDSLSPAPLHCRPGVQR